MSEDQWLLLLHQIPPKPPYFRAKVLRRLVQLGALAVKNSAYVLPDRDDTLEDFEWICREITSQGGAAWLFRAETIVGMSSDQIRETFRRMRAPDYEELIQLAHTLLKESPIAPREPVTTRQKLSQMFERLKRIDFFECTARQELEALMIELEKRDRPAKEIEVGHSPLGHVWVTRKGVKVDRIGSAWLIRRFIDPQATFRFVTPNEYSHTEGEIRFDMFEGEVTHEGDQCTFEVLIARNDLRRDHPALGAVAEIVHDIDLKDDRYRRPETVGLARMMDGLCVRTPEDELRLERGGMIFESLYQSFVE